MIEDLIAKIVGDVLFSFLIRTIERFAESEFAANVVHALEERLARQGPGAACVSAVKALFRMPLRAEAGRQQATVTAEPSTPSELDVIGWDSTHRLIFEIKANHFWQSDVATSQAKSYYTIVQHIKKWNHIQRRFEE
jgi:hypothetical protein